MAPGGASEAHLLEAYETTARPLTPEDVTARHELAVSVSWPHRTRAAGTGRAASRRYSR